MIEGNMSFGMGNFKGNGKVNGLPVWNHQLPLTMGGIIGPLAVGAPAKFGRAVSVDPTDPTTFLVGHPTGSHLLGILIADDAIMVQDPGMNDEYFEGRPATVMTFGLVQFAEFDPDLETPLLGMNVGINKVTGEIAFSASAFSGDYEIINASVYRKEEPNGVTVFLNWPLVKPSSETAPVTAVTTVLPAAGLIVVPTTAFLSCATPGAVIHYTLDGSTPTVASTVYDPIAGIAVTAAVTIKSLAKAPGYTASTVTSTAYTTA